MAVDQFGQANAAINAEVMGRIEVGKFYCIGYDGSAASGGPVCVLAGHRGETRSFKQPGFTKVENVVTVGITGNEDTSKVIGRVERGAVVISDADVVQRNGPRAGSDLVGEGHGVAGVDEHAGGGLGIVTIDGLNDLYVRIGRWCFNRGRIIVLYFVARTKPRGSDGRGVENVGHNVAGRARVGERLANAEIWDGASGLVATSLSQVSDHNVAQDFKAGVADRDAPLRSIGKRHNYCFYPAIAWVKRIGGQVTTSKGWIADLLDDLDGGITAEAQVHGQVRQIVERQRVAKVEQVLANRLLANGRIDRGVGAEYDRARRGVSQARIERLLINIFVVVIVCR